MHEMSSFAKTIMEQKYSHKKSDGSLETWDEIARRVAENVMGAVNAPKELIDAIRKVITEKKFIPGGRYLYASGRPYHQVCNCLLLSAEDSREGWAELLRKASMALMTGAGIGVNYSKVRPEGDLIMKTGGIATGPLALIQMVNEVSRGVIQGGSRRSAVLAILSWKHQDIYKYITIKNWPDHIRELKGKDVNFPATMDGTNISVQLDDEFFEAFHNTSHTLHPHASSVYWAVIGQMLQTGEPGFTVDVGVNHGETLRNAPVSADTHVLTLNGYVAVRTIVDIPVVIWTGKRWAGSVMFERTMRDASIVRVSLSNGKFIKCEPSHEFLIEFRRNDCVGGECIGIDRIKAGSLRPGDICHTGITDAGIECGGKMVVVDSVEFLHEKEDVYCCNVGAEEHSFMAEGVIISNCGEITSADSDDICNLGSVNMARISSLEEMRTVVALGTAFLLAGSVYSDVPYEEVRKVRDKNRRLGLGLMGLHEWLLIRGKAYGPDEELERYLEIYAGNKEIAAGYADAWGLSRPVKTRAIAPTGCQAGDTLIVTENGILTLNELGRAGGEQWQSLNVKVSQENGAKTASRFYVNGLAKTKKIQLSSGIILEATLNHRYRKLHANDYVWASVGSLDPGDKLVVSLGGYNKSAEPPLLPVRKIHPNEDIAGFPAQMNPNLARFLGIYYADGSIHKKGIRIACNAKEEGYKEVGRLGTELFSVEPTYDDNGRNCMSICFNSSQLLRWLYLNGLDKSCSVDMEMPMVIRCSSKDSINAFLDGYHFADGSHTGEVRYIDTVSGKFARQLIAIIRALGFDASIGRNRSGYGSEMYRVRWVLTKRKDETLNDTISLKRLGLFNCTVDTVVSIEGSEAYTFDIEVPENGTYIANGVVSHNTTGIVAETTTGIEPIFCAAYKRRYRKGSTLVEYQYVLDPTAKRLVESGISPDVIEDAYILSENVERRVAFQAWIQKYVDHGVSSCLAVGHSMIQTDKGLFEIEELASHAEIKQFAPPGFDLCSVNKGGEMASVSAVYNNGEAEVLSIECGGGYEIRCTPNHKVAVLGKDYELSWVEAKNVVVGDCMVGRKGLNLFPPFTTDKKKLSLMVGSEFCYSKKTSSKNLKIPERMSPRLARLLGYLCSDGHVGVNGIGMTQQENNALFHFKEIVEDLFGVAVAINEDKRSKGLYLAVVNSRELRDFMLWLGITGHDNIKVPLCIRKSGRNCVLEFIRGVTLDGYVSDGSICVASSVSKKYLQQLQMMLLNIGIKAGVSKASDAGERLFPSGKTYETKTAWKLIVSDNREVALFSTTIGFAEDRKTQELLRKYKRTSRTKVLGEIPDYGLRDRFLKEILPGVRSNKLYTYFRSMVCNGRHGMLLNRESVIEMADIGMHVPPCVIDNTYTFHQIKSVSKSGNAQTYDLSVPNGNSYIANGFICHNTINLPAWGTEQNNQDKVMAFGNMLIKYLPQLRGITAYPDGARAGQPLIPVKYHTAAKHTGQVFVETVDVCDLKGGSCGA